MTRYSAGALFVGIGGFCLGLKKYGIETVWANDNDPDVQQTYTHNFPETTFLDNSINATTFNLDALEPVDIIHAGFPCQSFSQAGYRKGFDDPRGRLFLDMMDKITNMREQKPKVLLFENSTYLRAGDKGRWFNEVALRIRRAGYLFSGANAFPLSANIHAGSPQNRERLFMFAVRRDAFRFNPFTKCDHTLQKQNLADLLIRDQSVDESYFLDPENKYSKKILGAASSTNDRRILQLRKYIVRVQKEGICPTLTANMGAGGHNVPFVIDNGRVRKLTERECLRLQGFPDEFEFPQQIAPTAKYRMIGNAVHVGVASLLGLQLTTELNRRQVA